MRAWTAALLRSLPVFRSQPAHPTPRKGDRVVVAMSGGVDSSVTAKLLAEQDYDLSAVFMRNWDTRDESGTDSGCEWKKDWEDVQRVCRMLDIPCEMVDLSREYWTRVFEPALEMWESGETPNPDVWCNREVKYGALVDRLIRKDAWLATGHYADKTWARPPLNLSNLFAYDKIPPRPQLRRPADRTKDQTYYLSAIPEASLAQTLFPLAPYKKTEVREMAQKWGLPTAEREESMGICFVGEKRRFDDFIAQYIPSKPGPIIDMTNGKTVGKHDGLFTFTIGQNARIKGMPQKMIVARKDAKANAIYVVPGSTHPALYSSSMIVDKWKWIWADTPPPGVDSSKGLLAQVQYRYRMLDVPCRVYQQGDGRVKIDFRRPQLSVAPGQVAAIWKNDWCLGFGFHNASAIDSLLDKEDVSLEAVLDDDDLVQECKAQNTRLIDYFSRVDVLQRLLGYVTGQIGGDEKGSFKYPYVATEVLCSEIWSIVDTCIRRQDQLLVPFWETVLDKSPEEMKSQVMMATHFAKVNVEFLSKKPAEMLAFIQAQPNIAERILRHIESPPFADLLVRIIQLDEHPAGAGVLDWLSKENLMSRLIDLLSPAHSSDMHTVVAELIKGIISMAAPSPAAGISDGLNHLPASNIFARELASRENVSKLVSYILCDFGPNSQSDQVSPVKEEEGTLASPKPLSPESAASSVVQSICIIIELIRQNNSDYFEPYLFHTLRNRLIQVQQQLQMNPAGGRETLEAAMKEMVNRMGVVHLGPVLELMCEHLPKLQQFLKQPRSLNGPVLTTVGALPPLTFERYRICELYAELLHCSNMSLLNRSPEYDHLYDSEGRLQGGLSALEELAQVIAIGNGSGDNDGMDDDETDEVESAHEFPVSHAPASNLTDSDDDMSGDEPGSSDDDAMEEIAMYDSPAPDPSPAPSGSPSSIAESPAASPSPSAQSPSPSTSPSDIAAFPQHRQNSWSSDTEGPVARPRSASSRRSVRRSTRDTLAGRPVLGERLKQRFLEVNVCSSLLDLFFDFPWNNFLHSVVYDLIHQILTGRLDGGYNRELTVALFRDARLMHRIIEGSKRNDIESSAPKGVRLGYMGHLTLISEDVINALEHLPPDLRLQIAQYAPQPEWDEYVTGRYKETKKKDNVLLGGGKPVIAPSMRNAGAPQWKVDEADAIAASAPARTEQRQAGPGPGPGSEMRGEFRRTAQRREGSADFGAMPMDEEEEEFSAAPSRFANYLVQEMQSSDHLGSSDEASDEEEDGGWLAQSAFELRQPPVTARQHDNGRRPLSSSGFEDTFTPADTSQSTSFQDPFEDDTFGPFSDSAAASGSDPFNFPSTAATEEFMEDSSFESFGDFGDFQSAGSASFEAEGTLTPTGADSWSFASASSTGSFEDSFSDRRPSDAGSGSGPNANRDQDERTARDT
ncbi:SIT4 phosphatase-associated protein-domain-containing protein [Trametes polyzona]|nr:SIT4 phosphatase-associated protein-domain-containing protein [Trametes polyzona]